MNQIKKSLSAIISLAVSAVLAANCTAYRCFAIEANTCNEDILSGDVNMDGIVNVKDVTAVQRYISEFTTLNDKQIKVADLNGDGFVTVKDSTQIQRCLAEFAGVVPFSVNEPFAFTWKDSPVHGKIYTDYRNTYNVEFDVSVYKNETGKVLYVSPNGSDKNYGTESSPLYTMSKAYEKGADTIYLLPGIYKRGQTLFGIEINRSLNIIGTSVNGDVIVSTDHPSYMEQTSDYSSVWSAVRGNLSNVIDINNKTGDGHFTKYKQVDTVEEVETTEGSWAHILGVAYIHTIGDVKPTESNGILLLHGNKKTPLFNFTNGNLYMENLICVEGSSPLSVNSLEENQVINVYAKNCKFFYSLSVDNDVCMMKGVTLSIFQNCEASFGLKDGFNYHIRNGIIPKAIEINCHGLCNGNVEDGNDQGSSLHDGGSIIRIGDVCAWNYGSNYAEQGTGSESWNINCTGFESRCLVTKNQNANFFAYGNTKIFCEGCVGFGSYYNVNNSANISSGEKPGEIFLHNPRFTGTLTRDGVEPVYY